MSRGLRFLFDRNEAHAAVRCFYTLPYVFFTHRSTGYPNTWLQPDLEYTNPHGRIPRTNVSDHSLCILIPSRQFQNVSHL
jgi:hypothetical protein